MPQSHIFNDTFPIPPHQHHQSLNR
ncbi:hypothetical protein RDI58_026690 [Solanum bulbocastanum]|uniref:Uncharacterized protein n=1 Tax=Solanum bulbocastanum TaxID=147425 RepID=A0AAN8Y1D1_SOLBU